MTQDSIADDRVQRILAEVGVRRCALESFRDGRLIDGLACRMTMGRLALMGVANCKIFSSDDDVELTEDDVIEAWWFTIEDNIDMAVMLADQPELLAKEIAKLKKGRTKNKMSAIVDDVQAWLTDIAETMPQGKGGDEGGCVMRADWWADALDVIASQYHWSEEFILWYLPLVRAIKYQERICARTNGEAVSEDIGDDITGALDKIEEMKTDG
jgi:hypothetical protein